MHVPQMVIPEEKCLRHCRRLLLFLLLLLQWSSFYFLVLIESTPTPPLPSSSPVSMLFLPYSPACVHSFSSLFLSSPMSTFLSPSCLCFIPIFYPSSLPPMSTPFFSFSVYSFTYIHTYIFFFVRLKCSMSIPLTSDLRFQSFIHLFHLFSSFFVLSSLLTFHCYVVSLSHLFYYFFSFHHHHTLVSFLTFCSFVSNKSFFLLLFFSNIHFHILSSSFLLLCFVAFLYHSPSL